MAPRQQYRVVGHYVTVKTMTLNGPMVVGLLKGALLPPDVEQATLDHLLSVKLIEALELVAPAAPVVVEPVHEPAGPEEAATSDDPTTPEAPSDADAEQRRAEARAKLPADGSAPTRRHGHQVWVEYAVRLGYDREPLEKATRDEIIEVLAGAGA